MTFNEYANQPTAPSSGDFMSIDALALAIFPVDWETVSGGVSV